MSTNIEDGDAPPELIDVSTMPVEQPVIEEESTPRVPITLVTGYLGAGKTTLLNYILKEKHGKKIAVIMNEFGDSSDIEKPLTVNQGGQEVTEWMEVGNGCICCSVKDTGVMALESLMERRGTFDYILLETTGLADPGNIAPVFWMDEGLGSSIYLDGIVTLVDAKNIMHLLDEPTPEEKADSHNDDHDHDHGSGPVLSMAHMQISHADVIILNKTDLVTPDELEAVRDRISAINSVAKIHVTDHSRTPQIEGVVLDLHAYDHLADLDFSKKGHSHIDPAISTVAVVTPPIPADKVSKVDSWLQSVLWESTFPVPANGTTQTYPTDFEIHRLKGILRLEDGSNKIIQAVRDVFEIRDSEPTQSNGDETSVVQCKIVLIGRGLGPTADTWRESFESFVRGN
ncbi:COBW domain-containing protein 1 [Penicillium macrosclerotiorum]|uniref:COBW domain-containing protein 1 n=1 Tax=Penicillium macrosclerotiorum TaxID=303699 RepID=UPI002547D57D|nr:COBW domain-containing protein 1 [Penicillium macrosclerotiorum]KAJ5666768.1 COBW domain-containing protein 1 [Penicillium macrosclerotiorum]